MTNPIEVIPGWRHQSPADANKDHLILTTFDENGEHRRVYVREDA